VSAEYRLSGLYLVDSICKTAQNKLGDKDFFTPQFAKRIEEILNDAFECPPKDRVSFHLSISFSHPLVFSLLFLSFSFSSVDCDIDFFIYLGLCETSN
jgi:hypothetical protein